MILMENITSRKNRIITHLRAVASDAQYRNGCREFICDGEKTLREALSFGAEICCVLWKDKAAELSLPESVMQYTAPAELFEYASPLKSSGGPVFTVKMPDDGRDYDPGKVIVLENLQDPGNVGTVIRTADAFSFDGVIFSGTCADPFAPKTVRSTMGSLFRVPVFFENAENVRDYCKNAGIKLYAAALSDDAKSIKDVDLREGCVMIGNEAHGLSESELSLSDEKVIIPIKSAE